MLGPQADLFKAVLVGASVFIAYYAARELKLKSDVLKFFLIPAILNIVLIFVQKFDHTAMTFINVQGVTGF